jgi:hypothetical protein
VWNVAAVVRFASSDMYSANTLVGNGRKEMASRNGRLSRLKTWSEAA